MGFWNFLVDNIRIFSTYAGSANVTTGHVIMILVGALFVFLGIHFRFRPLLLILIGFGMLIDNIPFEDAGLQISIYKKEFVLSILHQGVRQGWYPPLIFPGIGAMTDSLVLISNPKLMLTDVVTQFGVFGVHMIALQLGFEPSAAGTIGIIDGADGPTAILLSSKLAPDLLGAITVPAHLYMALVPTTQPPFMRSLTISKERYIRMKAPRKVPCVERILFPIFGLLLTSSFVPSGLSLLGMPLFGSILKGNGVRDRLAHMAREPLIDITTILLGVIVGVLTQVTHFLTLNSVKIFMLDALSFIIATYSRVPFAKAMNLFLKGSNRINPLIGNAGASAVPNSARVSQIEGAKYNWTNYLLMHAMSLNVAGVIDSAVAAGVLLGFLL